MAVVVVVAPIQAVLATSNQTCDLGAAKPMARLLHSEQLQSQRLRNTINLLTDNVNI